MKSIFEEEGLEQQGNAALEGLKQFMYMGTESLVLVIVSPVLHGLGEHFEAFEVDHNVIASPMMCTLSVQEKLCLIAMSLPAHYLCIQQVIVAFQVSEVLPLNRWKSMPKLISYCYRCCSSSYLN